MPSPLARCFLRFLRARFAFDSLPVVFSAVFSASPRRIASLKPHLAKPHRAVLGVLLSLWNGPIDTAGGACTILVGTYFTSETEVAQNVESQETPARILP